MNRDEIHAILREAINDAWRLGLGTAIGLLELHRKAGTPLDRIIDDLRRRSGEPDE